MNHFEITCDKSFLLRCTLHKTKIINFHDFFLFVVVVGFFFISIFCFRFAFSVPIYDDDVASGKKLQRLKLSICARGIETFDAVTGITLHKVSIYQISYCSADAAHSNVFAFIAGQGVGPHDMCNNDTDELTCYAFLCAKRKIAYNLTITVAKNFERAYDMWKKSELRRKTEQYEPNRLNIDQTNTLQIKSNLNGNEQNCGNINRLQNDGRKSLLIDFNSDTLTPVERQRQLLQTAWVSFDDEPLLNNDNNTMQPMSGKIFENNLWDLNAICS